ncbi:MAG: LPXTG cell wall anchor domain-containing protein, partial [Actinomycetes bacterium]
TTTEPPVTVLGSTTIAQPTTTTTEGPPPSVLGATTVVERTTTTVGAEPESKVLGITAERGASADLAQTGTQSGVLAAGALALLLGGLLLLGVRGRRLDG